MSFLYDFIPVILFFIAFKYFDIYVATIIGISITALQVLISTIWKRKLDKQQLITLVVFVLFGGMTLYFHNPIFVKWKPTIVYWIFGLVLVGSHFIGQKTLMQRMLEHLLEKDHAPISAAIFKKINAAWAIFFIVLGGVNLFVAYHFSTNAWVNFKLYGTLGLLLAFSVLQSIYLSKYLVDVK